MTLVSFIIILVFAFCLYYLASPLFNSSTLLVRSEHVKITEDLRYRKEEVLESLKEFELDRQMKKISNEDYDSLYQEAFAEGKKILQEIDQRNEEAPVVTKAPASVSSETPVSRKPVRFCIHCSEPVVAGAKFCGQCGNKLPS